MRKKLEEESQDLQVKCAVEVKLHKKKTVQVTKSMTEEAIVVKVEHAKVIATHHEVSALKKL